MTEDRSAGKTGSYADIGLVLEGGGFRGIYTAAVLDVLQHEKLFFNYAVGVSAGAAYGVSYVSRQYERNLSVNEYVSDKRYCSFRQLIKTGSYFNWDFIYKEIPLHIVPFDYEAFNSSSTHMQVGLTNCMTGQAEYKTMKGSSPDRFSDLLTATSSLPFISRMKLLDNQYYLDGGISDPIPVKQAFSAGVKRAIVILTRDSTYRKRKPRWTAILKLAYCRYPELVRVFIARDEIYNRTLDDLNRLEADGRVFIIRPGQPLPVSRLENNPAALKKAYDVAVRDTNRVMMQLKAWINKR